MKFIKSFHYAWLGIRYGLRERNMKIHVSLSILACVLGSIYSLSAYEWVALLFCIGLVISVELINTALEEICDVITQAQPEAYKKMGKPKDIGAAAVLISSIVSLIIGVIIFMPYVAGKY